MKEGEYPVEHCSQEKFEVPKMTELSDKKLIVFHPAGGDDGYGFTRHIHLATSRHRFHLSDGIDYIQALDNFSEDTIPKTSRSVVPMV